MSFRLIERSADRTSVSIRPSRASTPVGFFVFGAGSSVVISPDSMLVGPFQRNAIQLPADFPAHAPSVLTNLGPLEMRAIGSVWYATAIPEMVDLDIVTASAKHTSTPVQEEKRFAQDDAIRQLFDSIDAQVTSLITQNYVQVAPEVITAASEAIKALEAQAHRESDEAWATRIADQTSDFGD